MARGRRRAGAGGARWSGTPAFLARPRMIPTWSSWLFRPPRRASVVVHSLRRYLRATVSDVVSTKAELQHEVESGRVDIGRFVPGHPLAGREVSVRVPPGAICSPIGSGRSHPAPGRSPSAPLRSRRVAREPRRGGGGHVRGGARPGGGADLPHPADRLLAGRGGTRPARCRGSASVRTGASRHDPAGRFRPRPLDRDPRQQRRARLGRARRPASSGWPRSATVSAGRGGTDGRPRRRCAAGVAGALKVPGKHGAQPMPYAVVPVVIEDRPGELGRLFASAGARRSTSRTSGSSTPGEAHRSGRAGGAPRERRGRWPLGLREDGFEVRD